MKTNEEIEKISNHSFRANLMRCGYKKICTHDLNSVIFYFNYVLLPYVFSTYPFWTPTTFIYNFERKTIQPHDV